MDCRICGRPLTADESINRGVGPSCAKHLPSIPFHQIQNKRVRYWFGEAYDSLPSAFVLAQSKQYIESSFFSHLSVEKAIKGVFQLRNEKSPPRSHNLMELAAACDMQLTQEQVHLLSTLNYFQQQGRYPTNRKKLLNTYPASFFEGLSERVAEFLKHTTKIVKKEQNGHGKNHIVNRKPEEN